MVPMDLNSISIKTSIPEVVLPTTAVEISKSVANVAIEKISSVPDRAPVSAIPSAAVDISKSLATVVAAGTNVATETGTRAITSLFGRLGGVINVASSSLSLTDTTNITKEEIPFVSEDHDITIKEKPDGEDNVKILPSKRSPNVKINCFYESVFRNTEPSMLGDDAENSQFEDFSSNSNLSIDLDTLNLVRRHYRNAIEVDEKEEIEWSMLQDIILIINNEDVSIGASIILSELLEKQNKFVTIEENSEVVATTENSDGDAIKSGVLETDGWENDWSDPDLSGLSDNEEIEEAKTHKTIFTKTVNISEKLIHELINHNAETKFLGTGLALYVISLAILIEQTDIEPDIAFKLSHSSVLAIAREYVKRQKKKCDFNDTTSNENTLMDLFVKTMQAAKLYEP